MNSFSHPEILPGIGPIRGNKGTCAAVKRTRSLALLISPVVLRGAHPGHGSGQQNQQGDARVPPDTQ